MNDPKEIAEGIVTQWHNLPESNVAEGDRETLIDAIAAALQAEREDGCRRVNDAIGDRDPIIEKLKAELERVTKQRDEANSGLLGHALSAKMLKAELDRVKAERDEAVADYKHAKWCATVADNEKKNRLEAQADARIAKAERDEAVRHVKALLHHFGHPKVEEWMNRQAFEMALEAETAARALVEKVKQ